MDSLTLKTSDNDYLSRSHRGRHIYNDYIGTQTLDHPEKLGGGWGEWDGDGGGGGGGGNTAVKRTANEYKIELPVNYAFPVTY